MMRFFCFLFSILVLLFFFSFPAVALPDTCGIGKSTVVFYGVTFEDPEFRQTVAGYLGKIAKTPEFGKVLSLFNQRFGLALDWRVLSYITSLDSSGMSIYRAADGKESMDVTVGFSLKFRESSTLEMFVSDLKQIILAVSGGRKSFSERNIAGRKVFFCTFFDNEPAAFQFIYLTFESRFFCYMLPLKNRVAMKAVEESIAAILNPGMSLASNPQYMKFIKMASPGAGTIFIDGAFFKQAAAAGVGLSFPEFAGISIRIQPEFLVTASIVAPFEKDSRKRIEFAILNRLFGSKKFQRQCLDSIVPASSILCATIRANFSKEVLLSPEMNLKKYEVFVRAGGLSFDELARIFGDEMCIAVDEYDFSRLVRGKEKAPGVLLAISTSEPELLFAMAKGVAGQFARSAAGGMKMVESSKGDYFTLEPVKSPLEGLFFTVRKSNRMVLITTTREQAKKVDDVISGKARSLAMRQDYRQAILRPDGFFTLFLDVDKALRKLTELTGSNAVSPGELIFGEQKWSGISAVLEKDILKIELVQKYDMDRQVELFRRSARFILETFSEEKGVRKKGTYSGKKK